MTDYSKTTPITLDYPDDPLLGKHPGILGWIQEMIKHEEIQVPLCKLVNLILEQVKDRESTMSFPNEHLSEMLDIGKRIWEK